MNKIRLAIIYTALSIAALILVKVIIFDNCFAFDTNDDVNHTFVNLKAAHDIMSMGELPNINLYNNFGTPLLGDALTYPFSLQSITYWILPDYLAMTVNRALISLLTIIFLFLLLREFISPLSAMVCSLIVFLSPGLLWNLAHHHYQMSLLFLCVLLYIQSHYISLSKTKFLLLLWLGYSAFFLSVSIQLVLIAIPFLLLFLPFKDGLRAIRVSLLNFSALLAAAIITWPHTAIFFDNIAGSTRAQWSPYSGILSSTREQILALFVPPGQWMHYTINGHFSIVTYFSIAVLVFTLVGILALLKHYKANTSSLRVILLLGIVPGVAGFILQFHGQDLPFIRSVDSTRVWWFSNIFSVLAIGKLIDACWKQTFHWVIQCLIGVGTISIAYFYFILPEWLPELREMAFIYHTAVWGTIISLVFVTLTSFRLQHGNNTICLTDTQKDLVMSTGKGLIIGVLLLSLVPTIIHILGLNIHSCNKGNHFFSYSPEATFQPQNILKLMKPGYRMASQENPVEGHDLKAIFGGVLGSNARAIVSSQALMDIFKDFNVITPDANYYFSPPWQTDMLSKLGIRYLLLKQRSLELEEKGWIAITGATLSGQHIVYENPTKASLAYILHDGKPIFLRNYKIIPNGIKIELPRLEQSRNLVVSFFSRDEWQVKIDGEDAAFTTTELGMIQIPVDAQNRTVLLKYKSLTIWDFLIYLSYSIVILLMAYFSSRLHHKKETDNAST